MYVHYLLHNLNHLIFIQPQTVGLLQMIFFFFLITILGQFNLFFNKHLFRIHSDQFRTYGDAQWRICRQCARSSEDAAR